MVLYKSPRQAIFSLLIIVIYIAGLFTSCQKELHVPEGILSDTLIVNDQHQDSTSVEFIKYTIDGKSFSINPPQDSIINYFLPRASTPAVQIFAIDRNGSFSDSLNIYFSLPGIGPNSVQELFGFYSIHFDGLKVNIPDRVNIPVHITRFAAIGQIMGGNFTGTFVGPSPEQRIYQVTCSFQVRRNG